MGNINYSGANLFSDTFERYLDASPAIQASYNSLHRFDGKNTHLLDWELPWTVNNSPKIDDNGDDACGYIRYGVQDSTGKVTPRYKSCTSIKCTHRSCRISWMKRRSEKATARILGWMSITKKDIMHLTVSLSQDEDDYESLEKFKLRLLEAKKMLKHFGLEDYAIFFHSHRSPKERAKASVDDNKYIESMEGVEWVWGPHFHVIAPRQWISKRFDDYYNQTGHIIKIHRSMELKKSQDADAINRLFFYEVSHIGIPCYQDYFKSPLSTDKEIAKTELIRWYGEWSKRKLKIIDVENRQEFSLDPVSGEKMPIMALTGFVEKESKFGGTYQSPQWTLGQRIRPDEYWAEQEVVPIDKWCKESVYYEKCRLATYTVEYKGQTVRLRRNQGNLQTISYSTHTGQVRSFDAIVNRWELLKGESV